MSIRRACFILFILMLSIFQVHTASAKETFVDVPSSHDAYEEIQYLVNLGAINGYKTDKGTYFKPQEPVKRWQAAKMVTVSIGLKPLEVTKSSFSDVKAGTEISNFVERAVKEGYFSEYEKGKFAPNIPLTRQEMAKVLAIAFDLDVDKYANLAVPFKDITPKHPYYKYISAIYYNGITQGSPSGNNRVFMPESSVTRGQFASFIARAKEDKYRLDLPVQGISLPNANDAVGMVASIENNLNVRTSPDATTNNNRIGQIQKGDQLPLFEIQNGWYKVLYNGQYAYISSKYAQVLDESGKPLGKVQKEVVANENLNVYKSSNANAKVIGFYKNGDKLSVYKSVGDWYLTTIGGLPGYVKIAQTKEIVKEPVVETPPVQEEKAPVQEQTPVKEEPVQNTPVYTTNTIGRVTTNALNIREKASATSNILGQLNAGDIVAVHSISGNWANITTSAGTNGYVHKTYLKLMNQSGSPVKDRIIVIDAGHGGKDPGATNNGVLEKDITLKVATIVKEKLEADGAKVIMTRSGDTYPTLEDRVQIATQKHAEVFVSIHVNSATNSSAKGTETYYSVQGDVNIAEDEALAKAINNQIVNNAGMKNRGVKTANYYVIRNMILPSVLVELGFITNPEDLGKLTDSEYIEIFGNSIYQGIVEYYQK